MKVLIVDIETTGFLKSGGRIVEIGIVELNLDNGEKKILFDEICWEKGLTKKECDDSWIVSNSTLTTEDIRTSKNLNFYREQIQQILNDYPLGATAFNNAFDFDFLKSRSFSFPRELPCPMKLSTDICKIPHKVGKNGKRRKGNKWPSFEEAHRHFFPDEEYKEEHRGGQDAKDEARLVYELYKMGKFIVD